MGPICSAKTTWLNATKTDVSRQADDRYRNS